MANLPPQQQSGIQTGADPAEHQLLQAGASQQHLQQARALGIDPGKLLGVLVKLIPSLLSALQELQGGGQATAAAP